MFLSQHPQPEYYIDYVHNKGIDPNLISVLMNKFNIDETKRIEFEKDFTNDIVEQVMTLPFNSYRLVTLQHNDINFLVHLKYKM